MHDPQGAGKGPSPKATAELLRAAREWVRDDPDPRTRRELTELVAAVEAGRPDAEPDLADRFRGLLEFGTAGLRGALGAGPNRMNRIVVRRAAAGLTSYLQATTGREAVTLVIGYDARYNSAAFARETAAVVTAAGGRAMLLPRALPTPVLAFAVRHLNTDAGVMVTASHNPATDNGYKVYLGDGCQIVPPADQEISAAIDRFPTAAGVPMASHGWQTRGSEVEEAYVAATARATTPSGARDVRIVHTALHGVGGSVIHQAFRAAGFPVPIPVASQAEPDPEFPTVAFPNPEEPGALDEALRLAREVSPDLVIASDPDADRCAVAIPDPSAATASDPAGWRMLRGDELGTLLGYRTLSRLRDAGRQDNRHRPDREGSHRPCVANSIVSSRLLGVMAREAGVDHVETLTGFKWIARVPHLAFGYEEALGYCVAPDMVRDKDGITAALAIAEYAAELKAEHRTLRDVLDEVAQRFGVYATDSFSIRVNNQDEIPSLMQRLRSKPLTSLNGSRVVHHDDLARGTEVLPPTEGLRYFLQDDTRVVIRPSGTEPKLKVYLEVHRAPHSGSASGGLPRSGVQDVARARDEAAEQLEKIRGELFDVLSPSPHLGQKSDRSG